MKIAAKLFLTLSHASHFGIGRIAILPKTRPANVLLDDKRSNENRELKGSRLKHIANACSWLID
ncbi:MAG: hypothetical protein V4760_11165 [Bdellovibrionota bacterium]